MWLDNYRRGSGNTWCSSQIDLEVQWCLRELMLDFRMLQYCS